MSKITIALEAAVASVIENSPADGSRPGARQRAAVDKAFARILRLIAPRIRHFIRQYGLVGHWDDAEQVCAIAVHRAIQAYDPAKAQFTTFVNWQIRGELQSLRFRLMTDQRPSAKKVDATTVSINAIAYGADGEETTLEAAIEDERALARTEAAASDYLAENATIALIDSYIDQLRETALEQLRRRARPKKRALARAGEAASTLRSKNYGIAQEELDTLEVRLKRNREIVERRLFDIAMVDEQGEDAGVTKERVRQITKRAAKSIAELAGDQPKFAMMADYRKPGLLRTPARKPRAEKEIMIDEASIDPRARRVVDFGTADQSIELALLVPESALRH